MALKMDVVEKKHLKEARMIQKSMEEMGIIPKDLPEILVEKGYMTEEKVEEVWEEARKKSLEKIQIEGYTLLDRLGKGSVGTVYKAIQKSLDREVSIKILHPSLQDNEIFVERFLREAKAMARVNSPYIVQGFDIVETGSGYYGIVMEFIDGIPLNKLISERKKIPEREAARIILHLTEGLESLASYDMVHRDIKPSNILIAQEGFPRLCDLGLAKPLTSDPSITQSGMTVGSPHYISPEQARDDKIDIRSDLYSLGVVFFEMVTGEKPFGNSRDTLQVIARAVTEDIQSPQEIEPHISNEISQIILKMTRRKVADRYPSPEALAEDLVDYLEGKSRSAEGTSPGSSSLKKVGSGRKKKKSRRGKARKKIGSLPLSPSDSPSSDEGDFAEETSLSSSDSDPTLGVKKKKAVARPRKGSGGGGRKPLIFSLFVVFLICLYLVLSFIQHEKEVQKDPPQKKTPPRKKAHRDSPGEIKKENPPKKNPLEKKDTLFLGTIDAKKREEIKKTLEQFMAKFGKDPTKLALAKKRLTLLKKQPEVIQKARELIQKNQNILYLTYGETLGDILPPLAKLDFEKVYSGIQKNQTSLAKGLKKDMEKLEKVFSFARKGLAEKTGQPGYALVLRSGKLVIGKVMDVSEKTVQFLSSDGLKAFYLQDLKEGQLLQLAKAHLRDHKETFDLEEARGLFYLFITRDTDQARDILSEVYGQRFWEKDTREALQYHWFRFQSVFQKGRDAFSKKRWVEALAFWGGLLRSQSDPFVEAKRESLDQLVQQAFEKSALGEAFLGEVGIDRGAPYIEYTFSDPQALKDWVYESLADGEKKPGGWKIEKNKLKGTGGADLRFVTPLSGLVGIKVYFSPEGKDPPSLAVTVGGKFKSHRKYGILAGIHIPLGDPRIFGYQRAFQEKGLLFSGTFQFKTSKKIETLSLYPLLPSDTLGKKEMAVEIWKEDVRLSLEGKTLVQSRGTPQGNMVSLKVWSPLWIEKIRVYGLPSYGWLQRKLKEVRKKKEEKKG